jgi:L-malate glycosyltransferase
VPLSLLIRWPRYLGGVHDSTTFEDMLTVLMATHNGAGTLPRVLAAYRTLLAPPGGYLLVVVNNASTDTTAAVLRDQGAGLPLKVLHCPDRGKNRALNQGLAAVQGDLVVLTDDDTIPQPDWLVQLAHAAAAQPGHDLFGGHIVADWPGQCPAWIARLVNLGATYGITPAGQGSGPVPAERVWGANMAVRRHIFDSGHRFNESVGPAAGQYVMGSETEFSGRLEKAGHKAWFVAAAVVSHIIRPHQLQPAWIVQRAYRLGRHMALVEWDQVPASAPRWRGAPRWKYRELVECCLAKWAAAARRDGDRQFKADYDIHYLRGYLYEAKQRHAAGIAAGASAVRSD